MLPATLTISCRGADEVPKGTVHLEDVCVCSQSRRNCACAPMSHRRSKEHKLRRKNGDSKLTSVHTTEWKKNPQPSLHGFVSPPIEQFPASTKRRNTTTLNRRAISRTKRPINFPPIALETPAFFRTKRRRKCVAVPVFCISSRRRR